MQNEIVLSDASCLIGLTNIDLLELLQGLFGCVVITTDVAKEYGLPLPSWFEIRELSQELLIEKEKMDLGEGEAGSIALASSLPDCLLIIDENKGRKEAIRRKLTIIGTLGILRLAKKHGMIDEIKPIVELLKDNGFRMSDKLIRETLQEVGEP